MNVFNSIENISMIWEVLIEEHIITISDMERIRPTFDAEINKFINSDVSSIGGTLIDIDKIFIKHIIGVLTNPEITNQVKPSDNFDSKLEQLQSDFNRFHAKKPPTEINFNINTDTPLPINDLGDRKYDAKI